MTPREANADLLAEITALRDRVASLTHENAELQGALGQASHREAATSEILRVISSSFTDLQPVMDAVAESAARLCEADVVIFKRDGDFIERVANFGSTPSGPLGERLELTRRHVGGRAMIDGTTLQIPDIQTAQDEFPDAFAVRTGARLRTVLAVPLMREGTAIGVIMVRRLEIRPLSDKQIKLLETFADQAVIAIENVRLFKELQEKNRALTAAHSQVTESLERQTATSEILRVIGSSPTDVQPVFETIARNAVSVCAALACAVFEVDGDMLRVAATHGVPAERVERFRQEFPIPLSADHDAAQTVQTRRVFHLADIEHNPNATVTDVENARLGRYRTRLMVPMVRGDRVLGLIAVTRVDPTPFPDQLVELLKTFADQAVIAIENVRLFTETKEALEQQTATSEILRVISSSPTDTQPVFDTIAANAARLCVARDAQVLRVEGDALRLVAAYGSPSMPPVRTISRGHAVGRAVIDRQTIHVRDMAQAVAEFPETSSPQHGVESLLAVPLLYEDVAVGVIRVSRTQIQPFTEQQIALLQTFADQAVIAIENVRLFRELERRNQDLTIALDRQTATADVLRIIARSPTDLQPVLDAIAASAVRLCAASDAVIERLEGDRFYNAAHAGAQMKGLLGLPLPLTRRFPGGRAILDREPVILDDIHLVAEREYPDTLELLKLNTIHSVAEIPLLSEGKPLGSLAVLRAEVRPFSDAEVSLLKTFADQAVIAIENVRLFKELESRNRDLTATSEILQVISHSPTDIQPVRSTPPSIGWMVMCSA
jgi:two-component system, NtrC family, sensor kinase